MPIIRRRPDKFPAGYELMAVCFYLRRSSEELNKAGILKRIKKTYPYGRQNPLYDAGQVEALEMSLIRHDGLIAFKSLPPDAPLIYALKPGYSDELDCECPECGGIAIGDPRIPAEERAALKRSNSWPRLVWCFACGFVEIDRKSGEEKPVHRLLGETLPEVKTNDVD